MTALENIAGVWFAVLNASALAAASLTSRILTRRSLTAVEGAGRELLLSAAGGGSAPTRLALDETGISFAASRILRRSHVTIELDAKHFVFHRIELPARAAEFIEAIVRHQIDRLTPWPAERVIFGWSHPVAAATEGAIAVTIAATNRELILPLVQGVQGRGATAVDARVAIPHELAKEGANESVVVARSAAAAVASTFWRRTLGIATMMVVSLVIVSSLFAQFANMHLVAMADDLNRQNAGKRALILNASNSGDPAEAARRFVEQRKSEAPVLTVVIEALSRILPETSYVTNMEITGTRLRVVGFTKDAPALIPLLGASDLFSDVNFFAPTTRLPEETSDRFSIELTIRSTGSFK